MMLHAWRRPKQAPAKTEKIESVAQSSICVALQNLPQRRCNLLGALIGSDPAENALSGGIYNQGKTGQVHILAVRLLNAQQSRKLCCLGPSEIIGEIELRK